MAIGQVVNSHLYVPSDAGSSGESSKIAAGAHKINLVFSTIGPDPMAVYASTNSETRKIQHGTNDVRNAVFTPDGEGIIFTSHKNGISALYYENGVEVVKLTDGDGFEDGATFSPDGKYLYFVRSHSDGTAIWKAEWPGTVPVELKRAEKITDAEGGHFSPAVSPDGKWIAFTGNVHSKPMYAGPQLKSNFLAGAIYMKRVDCEDPAVRVTFGTNQNGEAVWEGTPVWVQKEEGTWALFYYSMKQDDKACIYCQDFDSKTMEKAGEPVLISNTYEQAFYPRIVPGESRVVFSAKVGDKWSLVSTDLKGEGERVERDEGLLALNYDQKDPSKYVGHAVVQGYEDPIPGFVKPGVSGLHFAPVGRPDFVIDHWSKRLDEETEIDVMSVRGYFPVVDSSKNFVFSIDNDFRSIWRYNRETGITEKIFTAEEGKYIFGLSKFGDWLVTTNGIPFSNADVSSDILMIKEDGKEHVNLTEKIGGHNAWPMFSPDGKRLVFQRNFGSDKNLVAVPFPQGKLIEEGMVTRLTETPGTDTMPTISQDGKSLAFSTMSPKLRLHFQMRKLDLSEDGTAKKIHNLMEFSPAVDTHPHYSKDGLVAFSSARGWLVNELPLSHQFFIPQPYGNIFVRLKNGRVLQITCNDKENSLPYWY